MKNKEVILYFGSFNPIHNGHTTVAKYVLEHGLFNEVWFVVSPQNPLKPMGVLAGDLDRLKMTEVAVKEKLHALNVRVCDVEFNLPRPSYTIDTLRFLSTKYPDNSFSLLIGADIIPQIDKWKECETLVKQYKFYVYPREGFTLNKPLQNTVYLKDAPLCSFSSTDVREAISKGDDISNMVSHGVKDYIAENRLWTSNEFAIKLAELTSKIERSTDDATLWMERGKLYQKAGVNDKALNDFLEVAELDPSNEEAREYIKMLREIFAFRYMDYYNP